jgi:hypothetical protein
MLPMTLADSHFTRGAWSASDATENWKQLEVPQEAFARVAYSRA